ncbi:MAG TPA: hypothetical protein EYO07_04035 [Candidatus Marinimicrobia bacterium]|nr:hypothetical protein [Candidatus Neomarinimicrobiota bacterium]
MNLFERQITIDERATALTYQTSTISVGLSGLISKNYQLPLRQHLHLILIMAAQQIHLIDRLLHLHDRSNRISIIHRVFIGQARMIAGLWPQFHEKGSLDFFSDKQLEYAQYSYILSDEEIDYPRHTLLWEFGEEIAKSTNQIKNHRIIMLTLETYKYSYIDNSDMLYFIRG